MSIAIYVVVSGYAQTHKQSNPQRQQVSAKSVVMQRPKSLIKRIADINHQIDSLNNDIHREYQGFNEQKFYTDTKLRKDSLANLEREKEALQKMIDENKAMVTSLEKEYQAVDSILEYYEKGNIDTLYAHVDLMTLHIHKKIFGESYPRVMDDLQILLECAALFDKEYDEEQNKTCIQNLNDVRQCDTKDLLEGFLLVHKDVADEVNSWIKDEEHTLYSMVMFRRYLYNNYGVTLDADFPYLSAKVVEMVQLPSPTK